MRPRHDSHAENKNISPRAPSFSLRRAEILHADRISVYAYVGWMKGGGGDLAWISVFYCRYIWITVALSAFSPLSRRENSRLQQCASRL